MKPSFTQTLSALSKKSPEELNALGMRIGQALNYAATPGSAPAFGGTAPSFPTGPVNRMAQSAFGQPMQPALKGHPTTGVGNQPPQMQQMAQQMLAGAGQGGQLESAAQNAMSMIPTGLSTLPPQWNPADFQGLPQLGIMAPAGNMSPSGMSLLDVLRQPQKNPAGTVLR